MKNHPQCYGRMFPDFTRLLQQGATIEGKAFTAKMVGSGSGALTHELVLNEEGCEQCRACPDYETCYDFSLARVVMENLLMQTSRVNPWVGA